jgi:drug/metabolite transporter (DMT)-like permease
VILMGVCAVLLGVSHALTRKVLVESVDPLVAVAMRNLISAAMVLAIAGTARRLGGQPRRYLAYDRWTWLAVLGKASSGIFYFCAMSGLSATAGILLYRLNPLYTLILAFVLVPVGIRRQLSLGGLAAGTLLSVAGATLGARDLHGPGTGGGWATVNTGVFFMLLAGPCFSLFLVSSEKHRASAVGEADFAARQGYLAQIELWAILPVLLGAAAATWYHGWTITTWTQAGELGVLGAIAGGIGVLYFEAVKRIGALLASVIVGLEVHVTILCEWFWLGKPVSVPAVCGGLMVLAGVALVARENQRLIRNL